jgi:hypothetical protein
LEFHRIGVFGQEFLEIDLDMWCGYILGLPTVIVLLM